MSDETFPLTRIDDFFRYCLERAASYAVESEISIRKAFCRKYHPFKRGRKGEHRLLAGCRRIMEDAALHQKNLMEATTSEIDSLEKKHLETGKFIQIYLATTK